MNQLKATVLNFPIFHLTVGRNEDEDDVHHFLNHSLPLKLRSGVMLLTTVASEYGDPLRCWVLGRAAAGRLSLTSPAPAVSPG